MKMDAATLKSSVLFDADASWAISDARDADARTGQLLVSRAVYLPDGRVRAETVFYGLASRRFLPETSVPDMREARFFRDGIVGIVSNLHNTDLVFVSKAGSRVLLPGSEEVMYSSPTVLDESRIALIVAIGGRRSIGVLDVDSGRLSLVRPTGAEAGFLTYVRQLSASGGRIYFNFDSDDRLYKLGVFDGEELRVETTDYSGGVLWPRVAGGRVFYLGRFSEGDKICRYPGDAASAGTRSVPFSLESFDPAPALAARDANIAATGSVAIVGPYRPLAYASPFNMWVPYPDIANLGRSFRAFGLFYFQDPAAVNTVLLDAGYDTAYPFADTGLEWVNDDLPVTFTTSLETTSSTGPRARPNGRAQPRSHAHYGSLPLPTLARRCSAWAAAPWLAGTARAAAPMPGHTQGGTRPSRPSSDGRGGSPAWPSAHRAASTS